MHSIITCNSNFLEHTLALYTPYYQHCKTRVADSLWPISTSHATVSQRFTDD